MCRAAEGFREYRFHTDVLPYRRGETQERFLDDCGRQQGPSPRKCPFCGKSCATAGSVARQMACGGGPKTPHSPRTSRVRPRAHTRSCAAVWAVLRPFKGSFAYDNGMANRHRAETSEAVVTSTLHPPRRRYGWADGIGAAAVLECPEEGDTRHLPRHFSSVTSYGRLARSIKAVDRASGTVTGARNLSRASHIWENLIVDPVRQAKADFRLAPRARIKAWLRYWRSLAWWQGPSMPMAL
jgi:hypothetical protein